MTQASRHFELLLFTTNEAMVRDATAARIDGFIVDWEQRGKARRQAGADTEINHDTADDLCRVRAATPAPVLCRLNGISASTEAEIDTALACRATEILLPMVRSAREVESVLACVDGRCGVGILIETTEAVARAADFADLPLSRVYVGLNDLAIERGSSSIFDAVVDGTVDRVRERIRAPFGFGGLTLPDRGEPVPCRLLMGEMARLDCHFSFLRRSFHRDVRGRPLPAAVERIRHGLAGARRRSPAGIARDRLALQQSLLVAS